MEIGEEGLTWRLVSCLQDFQLNINILAYFFELSHLVVQDIRKFFCIWGVGMHNYQSAFHDLTDLDDVQQALIGNFRAVVTEYYCWLFTDLVLLLYLKINF